MEQPGSDEEALQASVKDSNDAMVKADNGPTDAKAAAAVKRSNDEQFEAERDEAKGT